MGVLADLEPEENRTAESAFVCLKEAPKEHHCMRACHAPVYAVLLLALILGFLSGCARHDAPAAPSGIPSPEALSLPKPPPSKAVVSIIIDDVGYNERALPDAIALTVPVDFAVLPRLPYTRRLAETLARGGFEIMLHQPMEPTSRSMDPGPGSITTRMSREQVEAIVQENLQQLPMARGLNNHMGSQATASRKVMETVLPFLSERGLFFLDSLTTSRSVCREVAADLAIPIAARDIFLDNELTREDIITQLEKLRRLALRRGEGIAIGHFHSLTLRTIEEIAPSFEADEIEFVFASEIIRRRKERSRDQRTVNPQ